MILNDIMDLFLYLMKQTTINEFTQTFFYIFILIVFIVIFRKLIHV